jgi:hypothetical protein
MSFPGKQIAFLVAGEGVELATAWAAIQEGGGQPMLLVGGHGELVQAFNKLDTGCKPDDLTASTAAIAAVF